MLGLGCHANTVSGVSGNTCTQRRRDISEHRAVNHSRSTGSYRTGRELPAQQRLLLSKYQQLGVFGGRRSGSQGQRSADSDTRMASERSLSSESGRHPDRGRDGQAPWGTGDALAATGEKSWAAAILNLLQSVVCRSYAAAVRLRSGAASACPVPLGDNGQVWAVFEPGGFQGRRQLPGRIGVVVAASIGGDDADCSAGGTRRARHGRRIATAAAEAARPGCERRVAPSAGPPSTPEPTPCLPPDGSTGPARPDPVLPTCERGS
jgi:hypothetical protein